LSWEKTTAVAVKIKLKRMGKIRAPFYRIIVADARTKRDGRAIEEIGKYHPKDEPSLIEIDSERAQYWLSVGAQPTSPVRHLLEVTGDWQKFKGLPGAEGTLKTAAPKPDKKEAFAAATAETVKDLKGKGRARKGASDEAESAGGEADKPARDQADKPARDQADKPARREAGKPARGEADKPARGGRSSSGRSSRSRSAGGKADAEKADADKAAAGKAPEGATASAGESSEDTGAEPKAAAGRGSEA
jgi:small subunit ribosomal protein S16